MEKKEDWLEKSVDGKPAPNKVIM